MRYALAVLTHGDNAEVLERTIRSFDAHVADPPVARYVYQDGPCALPPASPYPWVCHTAPQQQGFCTATRKLWSLVAQDSAQFDYVFWLEHDFEFKRTVSVQRMAHILDDAEGELCQVALMREPVNQQERAAGGLRQQMVFNGIPVDDQGDHFVHQAFFTTNPMLMTRAFMRWLPFPEYDAECEGRFGLDLRSDGYHFAFMGAGEAWVEHIGERTGMGY